MASNRPSRTIHPTAKLNADNDGELLLPSHWKLVRAARGEPSTPAPSLTPSSPGLIPSPEPTPTSSNPTTPAASEDDDNDDNVIPAGVSKKRRIESTDGSDVEVTQGPAATTTTKQAPKQKPKKRKKKRASTSDNNIDGNGMHRDVHVQDIDDDESSQTRNKRQPTADVDHFFEKLNVPSSNKKKVKCKSCRDGTGCAKKDLILVGDVTTLRRHMQAYHKSLYQKWAKANNFDSMLPDDAAARRAAQKPQQSGMSDHFSKAEAQPKEALPTPYSDDLFREAAIEWLIETNQPIQAFDHPKFKRMMDIAARATRGVKLPSRKQTRNEIIKMFKAQMKALRDKLLSNAVRGEVSVTCDSWQASNTDSYFAVTGHWIEETGPGVWVLQEALFGFTQMNTSHNGIRLGQALFKICSRLGIAHRVGHITCDNAGNNNTMVVEFARCYKAKTGKRFDIKKRHVRCLAHIINLATKALISTRSKAKYYSAAAEEGAHEPDVSASQDRDEIGLVRAICVKARSSSQRKELFKEIQEEYNMPPLQLLLDMEVRWGSTYLMLTRAEDRKTAVNRFVFELAANEKNADKCRKLRSLTLEEEEWERVSAFCDLLHYADRTQQAFSAAAKPTLHNALPAIEELYNSWKKASTKTLYKPFKPALEAAMEKLNEYYERTAESDAHIIVMVLDPSKKFGHFKKNWDEELQDEVDKLVKAKELFKFIERYNEMHVDDATNPKTSKKSSKSKHRRQNMNADDSGWESSSSDDEPEASDPTQPWLGEWLAYKQTKEVVLEGEGIVAWWGRNAERYPTWASLARDYLAIMASSVSSERAFSAAGITISKRRNRLKRDVVEALECIKSRLHNNILFREVVCASDLEKALEEVDVVDPECISSTEVVKEAEGWTWDQLVEDDEGDDGDDNIIEFLD